MREILFRGKRVDNGEWVEGLLFIKYFQDIPHARYAIQYKTEYSAEEWRPDYMAAEVDPATVGQFTGLTANGKKIFEGDMLKPFDDEIDKMVVEFHHGAFLLCLYGERGFMDENGERTCEGNYGVIECEPLSSYGDDVEVIGNIHDNPELVEAVRR